MKPPAKVLDGQEEIAIVIAAVAINSHHISSLKNKINLDNAENINDPCFDFIKHQCSKLIFIFCEKSSVDFNTL